jgi:hypothetical protein
VARNVSLVNVVFLAEILVGIWWAWGRRFGVVGVRNVVVVVDEAILACGCGVSCWRWMRQYCISKIDVIGDEITEDQGYGWVVRIILERRWLILHLYQNCGGTFRNLRGFRP